MKEGLNKLLQIATQKKDTARPTYESPSSLKTLDDMYNFALSTEGMEPSKRYARTLRESENWDITIDNRDEISSFIDHLHPYGPKGSQDFLRKELDKTLQGFSNPKDIIGWTQDNYYRVHPSLTGELEEVYQNIQRQTSAKSIEDGRLGAVFEFGKLVNKKWDNVDGGRATRSYAREAVKMFFYGVLDKASVNSRGDLTFPGPEGGAASMTLPDISDPIDRFIADNDLMKIAEEAFKPSVNKSREAAKASQRLLTEATYERLSEVPSDIQPNVIVDYAMYSKNPAKSIRDSITKIVSRKVELGQTKSYKDIATAYVTEQRKIEKTLVERINGYGRI